MFKHSPRRNGRNKGLKIKHVLQISVLLGVSVWLIYQLHHPHDKKPIETTAIMEKPLNDSNNDIIKLGRKDLRPKLKDTKEPEHQVDEEGEENEPDEHFQDQESEEGEDTKQEDVGENENADEGEDGIEKTNEMVHEREQIIAEMKGNDSEEAKVKQNRGTGHERTGAKNEKPKEKHKTERMKRSKHEGKHRERKNKVTKDDKEQEAWFQSEKIKNEEVRKEGEEAKKGKVNEQKGNEQNKVVVLEKTDNKVVVLEKTDNANGNKMYQNTKDLQISAPSEDHDQKTRESNQEHEVKSSKLLDDSQNTSRTDINRETDMNQSHPGQIYANEHNISPNLGSDPIKDSEKVGNVSDLNTEKPESAKAYANPINDNSSSVLSLEQEMAKPVMGKSPDSKKLQVPSSESVQNEAKSGNNEVSLEKDVKLEPFSGGSRLTLGE